MQHRFEGPKPGTALEAALQEFDSDESLRRIMRANKDSDNSSGASGSGSGGTTPSSRKSGGGVAYAVLTGLDTPKKESLVGAAEGAAVLFNARLEVHTAAT